MNWKSPDKKEKDKKSFHYNDTSNANRQWKQADTTRKKYIERK